MIGASDGGVRRITEALARSPHGGRPCRLVTPPPPDVPPRCRVESLDVARHPLNCKDVPGVMVFGRRTARRPAVAVVSAGNTPPTRTITASPQFRYGVPFAVQGCTPAFGGTEEARSSRSRVRIGARGCRALVPRCGRWHAGLNGEMSRCRADARASHLESPS